ncbi:MAG: hypothetical protein GDA66_11820 [Nitrospira sp. CR1.2]|nr:hypothetical protein [Nitrospira sp. CR1.2]
MAGDCTVDGGGAAGGRVSARVGLRRPVQGGKQKRVPTVKGTVKESVITRKILTYLNGLLGCYARKVPGGFFSSGWPDIVGCYAGRAFLIEVKVPGGKTTRLQDQELGRWGAAKARTLIAYSVDDVVTFMSGYHEGGK